jgi:predicted aspartyl protease
LRKKILGIFLGFVLCLLAGCSIQPVRVIVKGSNLKGRTDIPLIDVNDPNGWHFVQNNDGNSHTLTPSQGEIKAAQTCRVKYHWLHYPFRHCAVVEGRLQTKRTYPVMVDTGASVPVVVNDRHILENKLAIYPLGIDKSHSANIGVCHLPELRIGQMRFVDLPCLYIDKHHELQLFGLPVAHENAILLGLPVLQAFKYVLFDNIKKEVEFSYEELFEPEQLHLWRKYPFVIKGKISVEIPVEAEKMTLFLDTGCSELILPEKTWQIMCSNYTGVKLKTGDYLFYAREKLSCRKGVIKKLRLGDTTVRNVPVVVLADDVMKSAVGDCDGLLGLSCFRDTLFVLDFHRSTIWVRNNGTY